MTIRQFLYARSASVALKVAAATALLPLGNPAFAAPRSGEYSAALAIPMARPTQEIVNGVLWRCAGERCSAQADGSRPILACQRAVRAFGTVTRFSTPAGDMSAEDLSRCNTVS